MGPVRENGALFIGNALNNLLKGLVRYKESAVTFGCTAAKVKAGSVGNDACWGQ